MEATMTADQAVRRAETRPKSVVMSARVWPDVDEGFRELARETGLAPAVLLSNALDLLRADPGIRELIDANKAYDDTFRRIMKSKRTTERVAKGGRRASRAR
jgi:hypothetical protein